MYTYQEQCTINLGDSYTLLYSYIVRSLLDTFGLAGEKAAREGTRRFGYDRAMTTRKKHLAMNAKINMKSLFSLGGDLPPDPRFRRELQELNPQERVSHTLICPMADTWKAYGEREIGRIYCEEFHRPATTPMPSNTHRLTSPRPSRRWGMNTAHSTSSCAGKSARRAETVCFAEYDPAYVEPHFERKGADGKSGFNILSIKLYYYLLETAKEQLGEAGIEAVEKGLKQWRMTPPPGLRKRLPSMARPSTPSLSIRITRSQFIRKTTPLGITIVKMTRVNGLNAAFCRYLQKRSAFYAARV